MGKRANEPELPELLGEVALHSERLVRQQVALLRAELGDHLHDAGRAAVSGAAGLGLVAAAGTLTAATAVHLTHRLTRLPLWCCYGLAAGVAGAAGAALLASSRSAAGRIASGLPETVTGLKENLQWAKEQAQTPP